MLKKKNGIKIINLLLFSLNSILSIVSNIASNQLPASIKPYLGLFWPITIFIFFFVVILTWNEPDRYLPSHVILAEYALQNHDNNRYTEEKETKLINKSIYIILSMLHNFGFTSLFPRLYRIYEKRTISYEMEHAQKIVESVIETSWEYDKAERYIKKRERDDFIDSDTCKQSIDFLNKELDEEINKIINNTK